MNSLTTNFSALWAVIYLAVAYLTVRQRSSQEPIVRYLIVYMLAGFVVGIILVAAQQSWSAFVTTSILSWLPFYGISFLAWLFLILSVEFLAQKQSRLWMNLGVIWLSILPVIIIIAPTLPVTAVGRIRWQDIILSGIVIGWAFLMGRAVFLTVIAYRQARQPLHKNRIIYWALSLAFMIFGDMLLFARIDVAGGGLRLAGGVIAAYVVLTYQLADLLQFGLRALSFLIITLLGVITYTIGFAIIQSIFQNDPGYSPTMVGVALAIVLVLLVNPLLGLVNKGVHHLVFGVGYDPSILVREYSVRISNIVDLKRLTKVSLGLIAEALEIKHGYFFLVDEEKEGDRAYIRLQAVEGIVEGVEEKSLPFGRLQVENPMVACFSQEHRPLSQYDMDMLPEFKDISPEEQRWLADLNADVYVPIYTKEKWIGLFALGQKISGSRYYEQDLTLLSTLADQSVVALENARLLANLKKLNTDLENAYKALEKANQDLREMDELKSAFIGVITHELRTPLANVGFSLQIFEMYGLKHLPPEQRSQFDQLKSSFQMASMMIENLVTYASFLNNQVKLRLERLNIKDIVREVVTPLKIMSDEKGVNLKVDIIGELPPINADRKLLSNAMHQLVHNAVKFTKEGGKVWITCWATTDAVCFDVKDTGVGIPISKLPGMWSEFTQMADPLKRGVEGLGLGLALVKYIIAAHGGEVWAESQEGVGSVFGFQMPVGAARQPRRPSDIFRKRVTYQRSS